MNVRQISKKEYKHIIKKLGELGLYADLPKSKNIKSIRAKKGEVIFVDDMPVIVKLDQIYIPFIVAIGLFKGYGEVFVDKGAVKHITNGADVMRPGITSYTKFYRGDIVAVKVEGYDTSIAIGRALVDSKELINIGKGKVIINLHHIGDGFWETVKSHS